MSRGSKSKAGGGNKIKNRSIIYTPGFFFLCKIDQHALKVPQQTSLRKLLNHTKTMLRMSRFFDYQGHHFLFIETVKPHLNRK